MDNSIGVFISYSHQNRFEAVTLAQELAKIGCHCWIDFKGLVGGDDWREAIEQALQDSLVTIIVLTPESVNREWVLYEIERSQAYKRIIIPIMFRPCPIPEILERSQYIDFTNGPEYEKLLRAVLLKVTGLLRAGASTQTKEMSATQSEARAILRPPVEHLRLERPDGTMRSESLFYVQRSGDRILQRELSGDDGATVVIKAPRQVGKSSMLVHNVQFAEEQGKQVALLDFQSFDTLTDPELFYQEFCSLIAERLSIENRVTEAWKRTRSNTRASTIFMEQYVLQASEKPLVVAFDETDRMFDCPFRSDFFGMLRAWHNARGTESIWRRLDMILVISTEPYMLIENSAQSPFNVGEIIELEDFSKADVIDLNERHGRPFSASELNDLYRLTSGHPYLVRQALYRVSVNEASPGAILDNATYTRGNGGIYAHHLQRYYSYFQKQAYLKPLMLDVIHGRAELSDDDFHRLRGAGLIAPSVDQQIVPRCELYELYFGAKLK